MYTKTLLAKTLIRLALVGFAVIPVMLFVGLF